MRYDTSMYSNGATPMFNTIGAQQVYFAEETQGAPAGDPSATGADAPLSPVDSTPVERRGLMGKPTTWWVMLVIVFAVFVFISRKFGGPEKFGNIKLTVWNGLFSVAWFIIVLNFMKVTFSYFKIPGWSELVAAA
jgi:hypothetical protein